MSKTDSQERVIVGIDGSDQSTKALEWAAAYAQAKGATVAALTAWMVPSSNAFYVSGEAWDMEETSTKVAEEQLAGLRAKFPDLDIPLEVVHAHPAQAMVDASKDADLLVVGSRGHGGFTGLLLGSVSTHCVHAAHCPVVVIR
jgi:nucleotide-binding universal stress UspA family protein